MMRKFEECDWLEILSEFAEWLGYVLLVAFLCFLFIYSIGSILL